MSNLISEPRFPAAALFAIAAVISFSEGFYPALSIDQPGHLVILSHVSLIWTLGWWILADSKLHRFKLVYDIGFFLLLIGLFLLPYYLFKTRGVKALLLIGLFLVVYIGAGFAGVIAGVFLATD